MDLGIIVLAPSGKTALFRAVTGGHVHTIGHGAPERSVGVVRCRTSGSTSCRRCCTRRRQRTSNCASSTFLDASRCAEGPSGAYLASLGQCDAPVHVVRAYDDESVPHPAGSVDAERDVAAVDLDLSFADLATIERPRRQFTAGRLSPAAR